MVEKNVNFIYYCVYCGGIMDPKNDAVVETIGEIGTEVTEQTKSLFHIDELKDYITWNNLFKVAISIVAILVFYTLYRIIKRIIKKRVAVKMEPHNAQMLSKAISYVFYILMGMYILSLFGIDLKAIWGAAGVAGLAIGFAAQTSVSNIISGLFVVSEKTLKIGDYIEVVGCARSQILYSIGLGGDASDDTDVSVAIFGSLEGCLTTIIDGHIVNIQTLARYCA